MGEKGADDHLVDAARAGEPDAWRELYEAHAGRLLAWLRLRPTGDSATTAEDVAAEAWLIAAGKIADFHGTSSDFAGWLFGIARNLSVRAKEKSDRRQTHPGDAMHLEHHGDAVPDPTLVIDDQSWLRDAIASLPPRERDAVGLVDGLGMDTLTAAEALGISAVALRVARHRGLRRLRRLSDGRETLPAPA
ncbi:RNA polymerase sigma factor [Nocardioides sp. CN2-186]|uniref:RNA polymerase sigma factor n=1 Tax=Nocardioides tweenelious TaxID=3156607 RepID=UPI0032B48617